MPLRSVATCAENGFDGGVGTGADGERPLACRFYALMIETIDQLRDAAAEAEALLEGRFSRRMISTSAVVLGPISAALYTLHCRYRADAKACRNPALGEAISLKTQNLSELPHG